MNADLASWSDSDLARYLFSLATSSSPLTPWEWKFCRSMRRLLLAPPVVLTPATRAKGEEIAARRLSQSGRAAKPAG